MIDISSYSEILIPDLLNSPYITNPVILNNQLYFMEYTWNIRHQRAYFSLYTKVDDDYVYYIKSICLKPNLILSKNIQNTDWQGQLIFTKTQYSVLDDYRQDTISTDFSIKYFEEIADDES